MIRSLDAEPPQLRLKQNQLELRRGANGQLGISLFGWPPPAMRVQRESDGHTMCSVEQQVGASASISNEERQLRIYQEGAFEWSLWAQAVLINQFSLKLIQMFITNTMFLFERLDCLIQKMYTVLY